MQNLTYISKGKEISYHFQLCANIEVLPSGNLEEKSMRYNNPFRVIFSNSLKIPTVIFLTLILFFSLGCSIFHQQQGHFTQDNVSLHYVEKGQGQPVILIHGVLANSDLNWRFPSIIRKLSKNFHVISFDLRGHGKSDKPRGKENYGIELVHDICRLMDNLNIEKAHIVGYSLGGFIALKFATYYPEKAYSVTIAGAGWEKPTEENLERLEKIYSAMREKKDCTPLFELVGMKNEGLGKISIAIGNWYFRSKNDLKVIADLMESVTELQVEEEELKNCKVPILLIGGTNDPLCKTIPELDSLLPDSRIVWVKKGTHATTIFKKEFVKNIEIFITNNNPK